MTPIMMAVVAMLIALPTAQASPCSAPAAPDIDAARRIAQVAIEAAPTRNGTPYEMIVEPASDLPDLWVAYQAPSGPSLGGGGMSMRIDRCSGKVSAQHRQR
jgi:hypothetical protein